MTKLPVHPRRISAKQLVMHILEQPELVTAVQTLSPPVLGQLINHIGLEDAAEIVALSTTEQLKQIFDDDLWSSAGPGQDETFDADRFALWLEIMLEAGEHFTAEKLVELPADLVTLALHRHILVLNLDALFYQMAQPSASDILLDKAFDSCLYHEFAEYQVIARRHASWDAIIAVLVALDQNHADYLERLLGRCCHLSTALIEDNGGLYQVLTSAEMLETDLAADREDRRAARGYIAPSAAGRFLSLARQTELEQLATQPPDPITRAYFRELDRSSQEPATRSGAPVKRAAATLAAAEAKQSTDLVALLEEAEVLSRSETHPRLLLGAKTTGASAAAQPRLLVAMRQLMDDQPESYAQRLEEMTYLANVLVAGCTLAGRAFRLFEAAEAVMAVCHLGLEHLQRQGSAVPPGSSQRPRAVLELLAGERADRLFSMGWHILYHRCALTTGEALRRVLTFAQRSEMDAEIIAQLGRLTHLVRTVQSAGKPWMARGKLEEPEAQEALDTVFDEPTRRAVLGLLDECPTLGGALIREGAETQGPRQLVFIESEEQLVRIQEFLRALGAEQL